MDRLIIENIEGRIMLGIVMFVSLMILIGWVAINEPARMAAFEEQHTARSIERGAELYAANCATCHGAAGYGQGAVAPALNNPHMFGYSYIDDVNSEIASIERQLADLPSETELTEEREEIFAQVVAASEEEQAELVAQLEAIDQEISDLRQRRADLTAQLGPLMDERDERLAQLDGAILRGYYPRLEEVRARAEETGDTFLLTNYLAQDAGRLSQIEWGGDLRSYLSTTLIHGRPGSNIVWPEAMVAWSQRAGGPLRDDQIADIVAYIMNWDKGDNWTIADLNQVEQFARVTEPYAYVESAGEEQVSAVGTDVDAILTALDGVEGDAERGGELYNNNAQGELGQLLGCAACHNGGAVGPATMGTWSRTADERLTLDQFADYTVEQYIVESIVLPADYAVPGYAGAMPADFGERMSLQDMADVLAFIEAQG